MVLVWLRDFYRDFAAPGLAATLQAFLGVGEESPYAAAAGEPGHASSAGGGSREWSSLVLVKDVMRRVLDDRLALLAGHAAYIAPAPPAPPPAADTPGGERAFRLLQLSPGDVARELTLQASRLFFAVPYGEFLACARLLAAHAPELGCPARLAALEHRIPPRAALRALAEGARRVANWVASAIVSEPEGSARVALIALFLRVADHCHQLRDFSTLAAVWAGLTSPAVRTLAKSCAEALRDPETLTLYAHLSQLCGAAAGGEPRETGALRAAMQAHEDVPCVPLLDPLLADLARVHGDCGAPDTTPQGLLHLSKARRLAAALKRITRHQHWRYNFPPAPHVARYLSDPLVLEPAQLLARARACE